MPWKKTYGFHPLAAWCANTGECLAMLLQPGNAGSNTVTDHTAVLADALAQIPGSSTAKILVRLDGAGATHGLHEHLTALKTHQRTVKFTTGWTITDVDEQAIAKLPEAASLNQDGTAVQEGYFVAELSGLSEREGWSKGLRLIVRRAKPSSRHAANLTDFEKKTGWKYSIIATNIRKMTRIAGSHQAQWLDALHRHHAVVEDRVRTNKAMGLHNLPTKSYRTTKAGCSPRTSPPTSMPGCVSWPSTTRAIWRAPSPVPCASASTTSPDASPTTPAADASASIRPGPGTARSPWPGIASPTSQPSPDDVIPPRRRPGRRPRTAPGNRGTPAQPQRHAKARHPLHGNITGKPPDPSARTHL